eukprot:GHVL01022154.1.p1 GENE.GHVL01022154.1~~GHVL01022154.1.p1  ORF type:complete len:1485 (-),score=343.65 GHVL01022154.1:17-4027(-)
MKPLEEAGKFEFDESAFNWFEKHNVSDKISVGSYPWWEGVHPVIGKPVIGDNSQEFKSRIRQHALSLFNQHIVGGSVIFPAAGHLDLIIFAAISSLGNETAGETVTVGDISFIEAMLLDDTSVIGCNVLSNGEIEIISHGPGEDSNLHAMCSYYESNEKMHKTIESMVNYSNIDVSDFYNKMKKAGLVYGSQFQGVKWAMVNENKVIGGLRLQKEISSKKNRCDLDVGYILHPGLLDSAFQLAEILLKNKVTVIPVGVETLSVSRHRAIMASERCMFDDEEEWVAELELLSETGEMSKLDINLYYKTSLIAKISKLTLQPVGLVKSSPTQVHRNCLWEVSWKLYQEDIEPMGPCKHFIVAKNSSCTILEEFQSIETLHYVDLKLEKTYLSKEIIQIIEKNDEIEAILFVSPLEIIQTSVGLNQSAKVLLELQKLILSIIHVSQLVSIKIPNIWVLSDNQIPMGVQNKQYPVHGGLIGYIRSIRLEILNPSDHGFEIFYLDNNFSDVKLETVLKIITDYSNKSFTDDFKPPAEIVLRNTGIYCQSVEECRLQQSSVTAKVPIELCLTSRGSLSCLQLRPLLSCTEILNNDWISMRIRCVGLNFRDLLNVLDMYPGDPGPPGSDCSGIITEMGSSVTHLKVGDDVFGIATGGALRTIQSTIGDLVQKKPSRSSFEQASCMPVVFVTVQVALGDIAKLKKGDKILIHTASGGVGLAAIQFCKAIGVDIYATVGSQEKVDYIKGLGVKNITTSRDAEKFIDDMKKMLGANKLDAVLNTLNEDYIPSSAKLLKAGGKFLELGKRGIWSQEQMSDEFSSVDYHIIAVDTMMAENPPWFGQQLLKVRDLVDMPASFSTPLPVKVFTMSSSETAIEAFRFLQSAKHIGKIVLKLPSVINQEDVANTNDYSPKVNKSTWLITGGTGALGVVMAEWLIGEGVKNVVLVSRSGEVPSGSLDSFNLLKKQTSIRLAVLKCDVSDESDVGSLWSRLGGGKKPLGVIHLAGCVNDAALADQTNDHIQNVYNAKVKGAWNIHRLSTNRTLTHFILFSSSAALSGSPGQANYSAANSCLDALSLHRMSLGLPSTSIQWGPWGEQGMASNLKESMERRGIFSISNILALQCFEIILSMCRPVTAVLNINWAKYISTLPSVPKSIQVFSGKDDKVKNSSISQYQPLQKISKETVTKTLVRVVTGIVGSNLKGDLSVQPLRNLGVDSLGAVEFRNEIQKLLNIKVSATLLFDYPTIEKIADFLMTKITPREKTVKTTKIIKSNKKEEKIAIVGMALRLPGGVENTKLLWEALLEGNDLISDVPLGRWDSDKLYSDDRCETWMCYVKEDGLMKSVH